MLRPVRELDGFRTATYLSQLSIARCLERVPHPYSLSDFRRWFHTLGRDGGYAIAIVNPRDDRSMGTISLKPEGDIWHIGYWLGPPYHRRGIMGAALRRVSDEHLAVHPGATLYAEVYKDNPASARLLRRCGFAPAGDGTSPCLGRGEAAVPHWTFERRA